MANLSAIFNTGKSALFANQRALTVISQNIANINTPGYSRQEAVFESTLPLNDTPGQIGTGVQIREVRRVVNRFIESQVTLGKSNLGRLEHEQLTMGRVEASFNDAEGTGVNKTFNDFFAALHDLSNLPQGRAERVLVMERAKVLTQKFVNIDASLKEVRRSLDDELVSAVQDVNLMASQIADLNVQISMAKASGQQANDLEDQRGLLINNIAELVDLNVFEDSSGQMTVLVAGGRPLIEGNKAAKLQTALNPDNAGFKKVMYDPGTGSTFDITALISNGRMKALINNRDNALPGFIDKLDRMAASVVNEVNRQHKLGFGLDGSTGTDFFSPLSPTAVKAAANAGSATASVIVSDPTALTFNPYELKFSGGAYTLKNLTSGTSTSGAGPLILEGLTVTPTGAPAEGDSFKVSAHQGVAAAISVAVTDPNKLAAAGPLTGTVTTTTGSLSVTGVGSKFLTELKVGNTMTVGANTYTVAAIADNLNLTLTATAVATVTTGEATSIQQLPGGNTNAIKLARIQDKVLVSLDQGSLQGFYAGFTGEVGSSSQSVQRRFAAEEVIQRQLTNLREGTSGVSIDEEMANLIKFQRAFEASSRVIRMTDDLFQTILSMAR